MMNSSFVSYFKKQFVAFCEDDSAQLDILQQANTLYNEKSKLKTPPSYENMKNSFNAATVNCFDGFRLAIQKQINLNTVVSHFYWIGSQVTGQPIYQYRLILPYDEGGLVNVSSNADMSSVDGEIKHPINPNLSLKSNFSLGEQKQLTAELEYSEPSSFTQVQYQLANESSLAVSYMQSVTPNIILGGMGTYSLATKALSTSFAGMISNHEHSLLAQYDNNLRFMYTRKVNPNRVHLSTDVVFDEAGNSQATLGAEFTLKQAKFHTSVDSNLIFRSTLETSINPAMQMQFSAEMSHLKDAYKFGFGLLVSS